MQLMEKDFYKDLEKIKTIGSTYMAAVGLVPVAGAKVGDPVWELGPSSVPSCPGALDRHLLWASVCPVHGVGAVAWGLLVRDQLSPDETSHGKSTQCHPGGFLCPH